MSDNTDRTMKDLEKAIKEMPDPPFDHLIHIWQLRAEKGEHCESIVWNQAAKELKAACSILKGNPIKAFETLVII